MRDYFDELVSEIAEHDAAVDAPYLHGLLTGCATIPAVDLEKLFPEIAAEDPLPESTRQSVIEVIDFLSEDLSVHEFQARFRNDRDTEAERWIEGYLRSAHIHETQWREENELHPDAGVLLVMLHTMNDEEMRLQLDIDLPGPRDLRENPQLVTQFAIGIYQHFNGDVDDDLDLSDDDYLPSLPCFPDEELGAMDEQALFALVIGNDDRLPLEVVQECAGRKEAMVPLLRRHLQADAHWGDDANDGDRWGLLHAVFILGLIPGQACAEALLGAFRHIASDDYNDLADWFSSCWPALCRNKTEYTTDPMRQTAEDSTLDWYPRNQAVDCVLAEAAERGSAGLEEALDWLATLCADESQDPEFRVLVAGGCLLDHPRERHRQIMENLLDLQDPESLFGNAFGRGDIDHAFVTGDDPEWKRFDNPWQFYDPDEIRRRQARWLKESRTFEQDMSDLDEEFYAHDEIERVETYRREQPKIGRNAPCVCGSGRKYKQCCMNKLH